MITNANRKLPTVRIGDHEYIADFGNGEFRHVSGESKTIPMYALPENGGTFDFWYNNKTANVEAEPFDPALRPEITRVVTGIVKCDPDYFRDLQRDEKDALDLFAAGKSIYNDPDGIHASKPRYSGGLLPMINIYGTDFFLDLPAKELRQVDDSTNRIPWQTLQQRNHHFALWYDATKKNAFTGTLSQAIKHGNVKEITLPPLDKMIRDGVARHAAKVKAGATWKSSHEDNSITKKRGKGKGI